jgi:hypothetical protein
MISTDRPAMVVITNIEEHEDGSATYTFDLDKDSSKKITEIGLEFILTCAASGLDIHDALIHILWLGKSNDMNKETDDD